MTGGTLYLIPAAIGDPKGGDQAALVNATIPAATLSVLQGLVTFAVEDAKSARAFLKAAGIRLPIQEVSITEIGHAPGSQDLKPLIETLCIGRDVGLLSESGCPAVADPGALLVRMAHEASINVVPLVGPSSLLLALMASGLEGQRFAFAGYIPVKDPHRARTIRDLEVRSRVAHETEIVIETPFRNQALFEALVTTLHPATRLALAVDLTLPSESNRIKTVAAGRREPAPMLAKRQAVFLFRAA
jgi:16S rRNA (cytidine1402-2'-O)-methyltransferase